MTRPTTWSEWPAGPIRVGVAFLVAVAVVAVAVGFPRLVRDLGGDASRNSALSFADREIAGGNGLVADQVAAYAARALIPEGNRYHVAVSPDYAGGSDLTVPYVDSFYRYFLMPRRPAEEAPWIICYGCDLSAYGDSAHVVWWDEEGISIVRVEA